MRKNSLYLLISFLVASFAFSSCLDSDDPNYNLTSDALITSFSIGDLTIATKGKNKKGDKDSIYYTLVRGAQYPFTIDQINGLIYNTDSLPVGTGVGKVATNIGLGYGYYVTYMKDGKDTIWTKTDSINFEQPVHFNAYALDGSKRTYQVKLNVHRQDPDSLQWTKVPASGLQLTGYGHKAVYRDGVMYVFAEDAANGARVMTSRDGSVWQSAAVSPVDGRMVDLATVMAGGNALYALAGNTLCRSFDGVAWEVVPDAPAFVNLMACSELTNRLYGLAYADGEAKILGSDNLTDWVVAGTFDETFPLLNLSYTALRRPSNTQVEQLTLVGTGTNLAGPMKLDSTAVVWTCLSNDGQWNFVDRRNQANTKYCLPALANLTTVAMDGKLYAFGGLGYNIPESRAFEYIYESTDYGLSWKPCTTKVMFPMKEGEGSTERAFLDRKPTFSCLVDGEGYLWMFWSERMEEGQLQPTEVWKGRINRLGFAQR